MKRDERKYSRVGRRRTMGFSVTELLVTVSIIGIIAAIAYPSYVSHMREVKRADAHTALTRLASLEERRFGNVSPPSYTNDLTQLGYTAPFNSPEGFWVLDVPAATASTFTVRAQPTGGHADPDCPVITLTSTGAKGPAGCW